MAIHPCMEWIAVKKEISYLHSVTNEHKNLPLQAPYKQMSPTGQNKLNDIIVKEIIWNWFFQQIREARYTEYLLRRSPVITMK